MKLISGTAHPELAQNIAKYLEVPLCDVMVKAFPDGETFVKINENIRGQDVFIIQPTCPPTNSNLMELLITVDAAKRASAKRITAVIPFFGYARQDRKDQPRVPITAKLVANLLDAAGVNRVLTMDLHAGQIQGFFDIPVDDLTSRIVFGNDIQQYLEPGDTVFVSPDAGGVVRARKFADMYAGNIAIVDKKRSAPGECEAMNVIGDVKDKHAILVDDIVDSGGTLCQAAMAIMDSGARSVRAYITHGVLSGKACDTVEKSVLEELVITDSIADHCPKGMTKIRQITVGNLFGEAIRRVHNEESVSTLFN